MARTIQRAQNVPGMPGFMEGQLSATQKLGTRNDVFSQPSTTEGHGLIAHASAKLTKQAMSHVAQFTHIAHLEDSGNTHAEDKLPFHVYQLIVEQYKAGPYPDVIDYKIDNLYITASPCTSSGGTSDKTVGCTENLIDWHKNGMNFRIDDGAGSITVKLTIGTLTVHHLYKSTSKANAEASWLALKKLYDEGVIGGCKVEGAGPTWKHSGETL